MTTAVAQALVFAGGIGLLVGGAWLLISGGSRAAAVLRVPAVVVGLTVVAFGTSAPELFVSLTGALKGNTGLVLGNVIGSNVANLGLILALAALLRPVIVERGLSRKEVTLLLGATILFTILVWDGQLSRWDGGLLVAGFFVFMWWTLSNRDKRAVVVDVPVELPDVDYTHRMRELGKGLVLVILGIVIVIFGARRLPELGTGVGEAIKNFKKGVSSKDEIDVTPEKEEVTKGESDS